MRRGLSPIVAALILAGTLLTGATPGATGARAVDPSPPLATPLAPPLAGIVIAVDPGHDGGNAGHPAQISRRVWIGNGWKACNTVGTRTASGYPEHRFTYAVAMRVKARLEALGATVHLTRTSDTGVGPCVDARGRFGARVQAQLMVSIHGNGAPSADHGFFVMRPGLIPGYTDDIAGRSSRLASAVKAGLLAAGIPIANYYTRTGIRVRKDLGTLNMSDVPAVMVELGNMKNARDARRMKSSAGRDRYAAGIAAGIRRFLGR